MSNRDNCFFISKGFWLLEFVSQLNVIIDKKRNNNLFILIDLWLIIHEHKKIIEKSQIQELNQ